MTWSTNDELTFVRGLGGWRRDEARTLDQQIDILTGYRRSCALRANWVGLDKQTIVDEVDRLLSILRDQQKKGP